MISFFFADPDLVDELEEDIVEEAQRFGEITALTIYSKHPEGVVTIKYKSAGAAAAALSSFHGRFFDRKVLSCEFWDGSTAFSDRQEAAGEGDAGGEVDVEDARLDAFGSWLEGDDGEENGGTATGSGGTATGSGGGASAPAKVVKKQRERNAGAGK